MASGQSLLHFLPESREYLGGYSPQARIMVRNLRTALEFQRVTSGNLYLACFSGILPKHYSGGGLIFNITYAGPNGESYSNLATFNVAVENLSPGSQTSSTNFAAAKSNTQTPSSDGQASVINIQFSSSEAASIVAGNMFRFYLTVDSPLSITATTNIIYVLAIDIEEV